MRKESGNEKNEVLIALLKSTLLFLGIGISMANVIDDAATRTKYGHWITIGHLKEDGKHLDQMSYVTKSNAKLNVVTSNKRVRIW